MKFRFAAIAMFLLLLSGSIQAKHEELFSSRYFIFRSSLKLNAHLFLYNKAAGCKIGKVAADSIAAYAFKDKTGVLENKDLQALNSVLIFYQDSLLQKDLLLDSLMRNYGDYLSQGASLRVKLKSWQLAAFEKLRAFEPYFARLYWPAIDSANKVWLNAHKGEITGMENEIVPELERIYKTSLPEGKIIVDLACYATWAGAYSYNDSFGHIVFSSVSKAHQGNLAAEVVFHEASHFLVDKLSSLITKTAAARHVKADPSLWHNMIFYTTGFVLEKHYKLKWQKFEPYYMQMKFTEKFPEFKKSVEACRLYWDPYLGGQVSMETAINNIVGYLADQK